MCVTEGDFSKYVDVILGICTKTLCYTYLMKDQPPPSTLVVYSTMQYSTI